jgi:hypothetical protein
MKKAQPLISGTISMKKKKSERKTEEKTRDKGREP